MTLAAALTPLLMATVLAITITTLHRHLPPIVAARTVLVTLLLVLLATLPALWLVSLGFLAGSSLLGGSFGGVRRPSGHTSTCHRGLGSRPRSWLSPVRRGSHAPCAGIADSVGTTPC